MHICVVHNLFIFFNLQDQFPVNSGSMLPIGLTPSILAAVAVYCYSFAFGQRESTVIVNRELDSATPPKFTQTVKYIKQFGLHTLYTKNLYQMVQNDVHSFTSL